MPNPFAVAVREIQTPRRYRSSSSFAGGSIDRYSEDWVPWTLSTDAETRTVLRIMRARARQLVRDNSYAAGFVRSVSDNIVGPDGIMLQAKIQTISGQLARATNKEIERGWIEWGYPENASADGRDSWTDLQRLYWETMATDGEIIMRRHKGFNNPFAYTLQIIDADLLDETYNVAAGPGQNAVRMGVEVDGFNRAVAYHIWSRYPMDATGQEYKRERIPADQIIHDFIRYRPNQIRGVTWFAPALTSFHHLDGYEFAELVAARTAAAKMGFILNQQMDAGGFDWKGRKARTMDVTPGVIDELLPGQTFATFDPKHPSTTFDQFTTTVLRAIARGMNVSHLTLTGDLRQANYSSMRAGLLPERDHWRGLQKFAAIHCHRIVYRDWIAMALLADALTVDTRLASNYYEVVWKGRGWQWVDPLKDLEALKMGIDLGVDSRQLACAEIGVDYEDVVDELRYEQDYAEEAGVDVSGNQIAGLTPTKVSPEGSADDSGEPKSDAGSGDGGDGADNGNNNDNRGGARSFRERRAFRLLAGGTQ